MALKFLSRASNGDIVLAAYTDRKSGLWVWALYFAKSRGMGMSISPRVERHGQWHHYIPLPFGRTLILSRQDYHRDPRHRKAA